MLGRLRQLFASAPSSAPGSHDAAETERLRNEIQTLRAERDRLEAFAAAQERRAVASQKALETVRARIDEFELELYVARSDQQRAAVLADELRRELASRGT